MTTRDNLPMCHIAPPDLLRAVADAGSPEEREAARRALTASESLRTQRATVARALRELNFTIADVAPSPGRVRTVDDAGNGTDLPGGRVRGEGDPAVADEAVNEAYDGAGATYDFYQAVFDRDSINGQGLEMVSSVHFDNDYDNAFWNGVQMVYGDGSGRILKKGSLTKAIDVVAHELTHGVTQFTANLVYSKQSGALNESFSDVFGSLVKQYGLQQRADQADWLIGEGILGSALHGAALRSMKAPGTAWTTATGGKDRQPAHMRDYVDLPDDGNPANDRGGVHINSGIPNHAFYLVATSIGGYSWERAGRIWYVTLTERLHTRPTFRQAAEATVAVAGELFGVDGDEQKKVRAAWQQVGVLAEV
jgi:Zn-dependent metalloprotease